MNFSDLQPENTGRNHEFDQDPLPKDFSSVQRLVRLPNLRKIEPCENLFPPVENQLLESDAISSDLKQITINLRERLRCEFEAFEHPQNFKFTFPESKFPAVEPGTTNLITYEQKNIVEQEDTFRDKLSNEQIEQIAQNGEFRVKSNYEYITLPYVWKINDSLFKGKKNIELFWNQNIARAHSILNNAKIAFLSKIPQELSKIKKVPMRLFSLIFGRKSMKATYSVNYDREIAKEFWNEVMQKHYVESKQWGSQLWGYLDVQFKAEDWITIRSTQENGEKENPEVTQEYQKSIKNQEQSRADYQKRLTLKNIKKSKIINISNQFQSKWAKSKKKIFEEVSLECQKISLKNETTSNQSEQLLKDKEKTSEEQILEKFGEKKFQNYCAYLEKNLSKLDFPSGVIDAIVTMLILMQIMTRKQRKYDTKLREQKQKIQKQIKEEHKILQYNWEWYQTELKKRFQPVQSRLKEEYISKYIDDDLAYKLNIKQKEVFKLWLEYRTKYSDFLEAKRRQIPQIQEPTRTFYTSYLLLPPFKVLKHHKNNYTWYEMVREKSMSISTDKNFWKWDLYLMRVKSWTINCVTFLIFNCWKGPFGLRCLWGTKKFIYNQTINCQTGEIIYKQRKPMLMVFSTVIEGVKRSRENFQNLPDRGLFGKNFTRIINYVECYLFRFLFVGLVVSLMLYPLAIVCLSVLTFLSVLTVWIWMPFVLLLTYLFNILFFQFESSSIPYGFFVRSAPTLSLILALARSFSKIIFIAFYLAILAPIGSFFVCLTACISRCFRTGSDCILLFLIRKLGRTPSRNTAIAKKISGPGMSKEYYMSINEEDVYILIQSELQQIFMRQYNIIFNQKLSKPVLRFSEGMKLLLSPLQPPNSYKNYQYQNIISASVNDLRNYYNKEFLNYMNRFPKRPYNIRFTQQELNSYFENTVSIVKSFVSKNQIHSWIFQGYHILQDYEELTRKIWMTVFNCGEEIFEPLQKIDQRFKLEDMYKYEDDKYQINSSFEGSMKMNVHKVMEALEGQVELKPRKAVIQAFRHNLMSKELPLTGVNEIFSLMECNAEGNVFFEQNNPKFLFYVNLSIKQIIKKDSYEYEWRKKAQEWQIKRNKINR